MDVLRSYLVLACVAFTVGFVGYWMVGLILADSPPPAEAPFQAPASATLPALDTNPAKQI